MVTRRPISLLLAGLLGAVPPAFSQAHAQAQPAWSHFVQGSPPLRTYLANQYQIHMDWPSHAAAFDRLMLKTGQAPSPDLEAIEGEEFANKLQAALAPAADRALAEARRLKGAQASEDTLEKLGRLAPELQDLSTLASLLPAKQEQVIVSQHWLWAKLIEAKVDNAIKKDASFQGIVRSLSKDMDFLHEQSRPRAGRLALLRSRLNPLAKREASDLALSLIRHHQTISALEAADAAQTHSHILAVAQKHDPGTLDDWLGFLSEQRVGSASGKNAGIIFPLLGSIVDPYLNARQQGTHGSWRLGPDRADLDSLRTLLRRPEQAHLDLLLLKVALGGGDAAAASWEAMGRLIHKGLEAARSRDNLRSAMNLMYLKIKGKLPDSLWRRLLEQPPQTKEERHSLGAAAKLLVNLKSLDQVQGIIASHSWTIRMGYADFYGDLLKYLFSNIGEKLKLSRTQQEKIRQNVGFLETLQQNGLFENIASLASFLSEKGIKSLKRLVLELSQSGTKDGRFQYDLRYKALEGRLPEDLLERWKKPYAQSHDEEATAKPADLRAAGKKIQASLGISNPEEVLKFSETARSSTLQIRDDFLPSLKSILESLEGNRAPPAEAVQIAMPILGKPQRLQEVLPDALETLSLLRELLKSSSPKKKPATSPPPDIELLHVTDDPSVMIKMGSEPYVGCQRCTERTKQNGDGSLVNRLLMGQFKLANWTKGGSLAARVILEIGKDNYGRPALFVERLYKKDGIEVNKKRLMESLEQYARALGVATIYYPGVDGITNEKWGRIPDGEPGTDYSLFDEQGLILRRDSIGDDTAWDGDARRGRKANGAVAVYLEPKPAQPELGRWSAFWRGMKSFFVKERAWPWSRL